MKESERTLLFMLAERQRGNCDWDAFQSAIKAAYADQQPAEQKPSVGVSEEMAAGILAGERALYDQSFCPVESQYGRTMIAQAVVRAAAPYLTAAKDAELAAVIADNDAKMAAIAKRGNKALRTLQCAACYRVAKIIQSSYERSLHSS